MISRRMLVLSVLAGAAALAGYVLVTYAQRPATRTTHQTPLDSRRTLGEAKSYRNLTLIPVYDSSARATDAYVTLDEGLKAKQVQVAESKEGGDVNTLYVTNASGKPLYLMAGEVVLGGQQDRTLAKDTIIPAGKSRVPVTVFCVEHGRWTGRSEFDKSAPTIASLNIRANAQEGEFKASQSYAKMQAGGSPAPAAPGVAPSQSGNVAAGGFPLQTPAQTTVSRPAGISSSDEVSKAQQKVWDGVAEKNRKFKIRNQTGTYRDALTLQAGDAQKSVPAYVKALSSSLGSDKHLVGVVAAVNGKVIAADMFSDPALFQKLWPKLLRSYAADAVENTPQKGVKPALISSPQVKKFLADAADEKTKAENVTDNSKSLRYESNDAIAYRLVPKGEKADANPLHESVLRK